MVVTSVIISTERRTHDGQNNAPLGPDTATHVLVGGVSKMWVYQRDSDPEGSVGILPLSRH